MKKTLTGLLSLGLLLYILCFPVQAAASALDGLLLWFNQLVPALLPCMILTQLLWQSGILDHFGNRSRNRGKLTGLSGNGLYIAILGLLCGCPVGAGLIADFYQSRRISRHEALQLLCFSSQLSPAFLTGYVAGSCFSRPSFQRLLLISYYMSLVILVCFVRIFYSRRIDRQPSGSVTAKEASQTPSETGNLDTSITNSLYTLLHIGGYVVLFSVLADGFRYLSPLPSKANCIVLGSVEISTGLQPLYTLTLSPLIKAVLVNCLCAFGGLCGLIQVRSVLRGSTLPMHVYATAKVAQAVITAVCTAILFLFFVL